MAGGRRGNGSLISRRAFLAGAAAAIPFGGVLAACTGGSSEGTRPAAEPSRHLRTRWLDDPFARGAFSYLPLGATAADRVALAAPLDKALFFAGEATSSTRPATVQGAIESGRRAVSDMLAAGATASTRVVIIGAGAAGLAAATELRTAGIGAIVLEARDRIGGRVHTDKTLGVPVDLGASVVHDITPANPLVALARQAGVPLDRLDSSTVLRDRQGHRRSNATRIDEQLAAALARVGSGTQADAELAIALRAEAASAGLGDPELTFAITSTIEEQIGAPATDISWRATAERRIDGESAVPQGGMAALLDPMASGLDIRLRSVVTAVEWSRAQTRVVLDGGDVPFDMLVVTVPLGVLQAGSPVFDPPLPASKSSAIGRLGTGLVDQLVLEFPAIFWDANAPQLSYLGTTPGEWVSWRNLATSTSRPILVAHNSALVARSFDARTDEQLLTSAMSALRAMYR